MAIRINERSSNVAVEATKGEHPLIALPAEMFCHILTYGQAAEGRALYGVNKALKEKVLSVLRYRYNNYLDSICFRLFSYFSRILPEAYTEYGRSEEIKLLEKINRATTLREIKEHVDNFWHEITVQYFSKSKSERMPSKRFSMESMWPEQLEKRMCKDLVALGGLLTRQVAGLEMQIALEAIGEKCDEDCRQIFLSISADSCLRFGEPNIKRWLQFVERMADGEWKEEKMRDLYSRARTYCQVDRFIATEEFFSGLTLRAQLGYLEKLSERGRLGGGRGDGNAWDGINFGQRAVVFLDRVIDHPDRETRKEMLFLFGSKFLLPVIDCPELVGIRPWICHQMERGISTLSQDEQNEGLFVVLKWIASSPGDRQGLTLRREVEEYFKHQLENGTSKSEMIAIARTILSQLEKYGFTADYRIEIFQEFFMKAVFSFRVGREDFQTLVRSMSRAIGRDEVKAKRFESEFKRKLVSVGEIELDHLAQILEIKESQYMGELELALLKRMEDGLVNEISNRRAAKELEREKEEMRVKELAEAEEKKRKRREELLARRIEEQDLEGWPSRQSVAEVFEQYSILPSDMIREIVSFIPEQDEEVMEEALQTGGEASSS